MPALSQELILNQKYTPLPNLVVPRPEQLQLPEKVLQFGTGVLLRGLPDYFIDRANRQGIFNGRIVVVKSTETGRADTFAAQDNLYTLAVRGIAQGQPVEEFYINAAISRTLAAKEHWPEILQCAHNPELRLVLSNTTEVGIQLTDDDLWLSPPNSFPGKLTAFLYERFKTFNGSPESGLIIVPCELIVDNGQKLKEIVLTLARRQHLEEFFVDWLQNHNTFCDSLVDRIVPGKPDAATSQRLSEKLGYTDELLTAAEVYSLWGIAGDQKVQQTLSFAAVHPGVIITPDITPYRERKLRILNGAHTISVGLAYLAGCNTVKEMMADAALENYIINVVHQEIVPATPIDQTSAHTFADDVLDRFRNPFIVHKLLDITVQYTSKMNMRNVPTIKRYYEQNKVVPTHLLTGFAAYLLFMKSVKAENNHYFGQRGAEIYPINDDFAAYFYEAWEAVNLNEATSVQNFVQHVLSDTTIWSSNLTNIPGFAEAVSQTLTQLLQAGVKAAFPAAQPQIVG